MNRLSSACRLLLVAAAISAATPAAAQSILQLVPAASEPASSPVPSPMTYDYLYHHAHIVYREESQAIYATVGEDFETFYAVALKANGKFAEPAGVDTLPDDEVPRTAAHNWALLKAHKGLEFVPVIDATAPLRIAVGEQPEITWNALHARTCTLKGNAPRLEKGYQTTPSGAMQLPPMSYGAYSIEVTCRNKTHEATQTIGIQVDAEPELQLIAHEDTAVEGDIIGIEWSAVHVLSCQPGHALPWPDGGMAAVGAMRVQLSEPGRQIFSVTCDTFKGPISESVVVEVTPFPAPAATIELSAQSGYVGVPIEVTWASERAQSCELVLDGHRLPVATDGTHQLLPVDAGQMAPTIECANHRGQVSEAATFTAFTAPPPAIALQLSTRDVRAGATVRVEWSVDNADACRKTGTLPSWSGGVTPSGRESVKAPDPGLYTIGIECSGLGGLDRQQATLFVAPPSTARLSVPQHSTPAAAVHDRVLQLAVRVLAALNPLGEVHAQEPVARPPALYNPVTETSPVEPLPPPPPPPADERSDFEIPSDFKLIPEERDATRPSVDITPETATSDAQQSGGTAVVDVTAPPAQLAPPPELSANPNADPRRAGAIVPPAVPIRELSQSAPGAPAQAAVARTTYSVGSAVTPALGADPNTRPASPSRQPPPLPRDQANENAGLAPERIEVSNTTNQIVPIAIGHLNRIVTPFRDPKVRTISSATIEKQGSVLYVATDTNAPVTMYVTEKDSEQMALSLTLVPREIPPRELQFVFAQAYQTPTVFTGSTEPAAYENLPHVLALKHLLRSLAMGSVPNGFTLRSRVPRDPGVFCSNPSLRIAPRQIIEGSKYLVTVSALTNISNTNIEIDEVTCHMPGVRAVAAWPTPFLVPGQSTELFVVHSKFKTDPPGRVRPAVVEY